MAQRLTRAVQKTYYARVNEAAEIAHVDEAAEIRITADHMSRYDTLKKEDKFVPPGYDSSDSFYAKWKKEGKKWVVAEIGHPQA